MKKNWAAIFTSSTLVVTALAFAQTAWKSTVNGTTVALDVLESKGKVYVEANSIAKALGVKVVLDAKKKSLAFSSMDSGPVVQGTSQLAGGVGELGKTYTLAQGTSDALNFTLNKLEYVAGHFIAGGEDLITKDAKFVVLYATTQNPQKSGEISANRVFLSGVDSNNKTVTGAADGWYDLKTRQATYIGLKPGQKLEMFTYLPLENGASLPKLIVKNGDKVIRYELADKIAPLPAMFVDPSNSNIALETLKGTTGVPYPGYRCDLRIESFTLSDQPSGGVGVPEGGRLLTVNFSVKATGPKTVALGSFNTMAQLRDSENQVLGPQATLMASKDTDFNVSLEPDQGSAGRFVFSLEKGQRAASLRVQFGDSGGSRPVVFDLSKVPQ